MARILGIKIENYKALKDITLGGVTWGAPHKLTPLTVVIGKNGVGKSSIFDAFGFLVDCMLEKSIEDACNIKNRCGFDRLVSSGLKEERKQIKFTIYYRGEEKENPIIYHVSIGKAESDGKPIVLRETLSTHKTQTSKGKQGAPSHFLKLEKGKGQVWGRESDEDHKKYKEDLGLEPNKLGIVNLADHIDKHPRIKKFKTFVQSWYLSYFAPDAARNIPQFRPEKQINTRGDNMANVLQYLWQNNKKDFKKMLNSISERIPGINEIEPYKEEVTNNVYLLFKDKGFLNGFTQQQMSDGTLKILCYMLLLHSPGHAPFICIEEPENGLYHALLPFLVNEFREYTSKIKNASQVFVTTHQPYLVDALDPDELWVLEKNNDGFAKIKRADEYDFVKNMKEEGLPLGSLWYSEHLEED